MPVSHSEMIDALGSPATQNLVERLWRLVYIRDELIENLKNLSLAENWGQGNFVLKKYLAVYLAWSVENKNYVVGEGQMYFTAGHLQTRYGTPIYIVFERNQIEGMQPLYGRHVGSSRNSAPSLPSPPSIPDAPEIPFGGEIVMAHEHMLQENADRVPFFRDTPPVSQMCAISGAIQWALNRGLQIPYWYYGRMGLLVPLYLQNREDIAEEPDLIAPIQVNDDNLLVRTVLEPHMPYANARVSVKRHDNLPPWMLAAWKEQARNMTNAQIENPEASRSDALPS